MGAESSALNGDEVFAPEAEPNRGADAQATAGLEHVHGCCKVGFVVSHPFHKEREMDGAQSFLALQLYLLLFGRGGQRPGPKGPGISPSFRGLKPPAPSGFSDLQL